MRAMSGVFVPPTRGRSMPSGKMQKFVMPTTSSPAPRANSVSVSEGTRDAVHCQIADGAIAARGFLDARALVSNLRKFLRIEKARGAQIVVPSGDAGVDAGGLDDGDHAALERIGAVIDDVSGKFGELPAHLGHAVED